MAEFLDVQEAHVLTNYLEEVATMLDAKMNLSDHEVVQLLSMTRQLHGCLSKALERVQSGDLLS